jgi:hypothetical protein
MSSAFAAGEKARTNDAEHIKQMQEILSVWISYKTFS